MRTNRSAFVWQNSAITGRRVESGCLINCWSILVQYYWIYRVFKWSCKLTILWRARVSKVSIRKTSRDHQKVYGDRKFYRTCCSTPSRSRRFATGSQRPPLTAILSQLHWSEYGITQLNEHSQTAMNTHTMIRQSNNRGKYASEYSGQVI